ncbi:MAG: TlpA family protein disulfide reductase [Oligoflexia bacterium]|nr:TlpA family protein disulfide reductase [Oligoflexia bacterium]
MKKFFPFLYSSLLVTTVFFAALSIQLIIGYFSDNFDSLNDNNSTANENFEFYDYLFERTTFKSNFKGNNETLILSKLNSPIIILKFWTTWCPSCLDEFSTLTELKRNYSNQEVRVLAINGDKIFGNRSNTETNDLIKNISKLEKKFNFNFDIIIDANENGEHHFEKFKINSIPTTIIFVGGKTKFMHIGSLNFKSKKLMDFIDSNLKQIIR